MAAENTVRTYLDCDLGSFFFDAIFSTEIFSESTITEHPIQDGSDISDHAFENGKVITLDIGMSDVMEKINYTFTGDSTRSINAYKLLNRLQAEKLPIKLINKFGTFSNLLVKSILTKDTKDTMYGLKATFVLKEVFIVKVGTVKVSERPHDTDETNEGQQNAKKLNESWAYQLLKNNGIIKE